MELFYCKGCRRMFCIHEKCPYCNGEVSWMKKDSPVNVIGTKIKGRIIRVKDEKVYVLISHEDKSRTVKEYDPKELRKIV